MKSGLKEVGFRAESTSTEFRPATLRRHARFFFCGNLCLELDTEGGPGEIPGLSILSLSIMFALLLPIWYFIVQLLPADSPLRMGRSKGALTEYLMMPQWNCPG